MSVKGKQKESKEFVKELFVGFTAVKVVAINPDRDELNGLLGKEGTPEDKPIEYLGKDEQGNSRLRLVFWLKDDKADRFFVHSFNLTDKERTNKDGSKCQLVNSTCSTSWVPYLPKLDKEDNAVQEDGKTVYTPSIDESLIQTWFANFTDKDSKEITAPKKFRKALSGEEELVNLLRSWLGRLGWSDTETEVMIDTKKLFKENFKELRELISLDEEGKFSLDGLDTPFVILLGVRTDKDDSTKKYQQVWNKAFLPDGFMKHINNGFKFPTDYGKKIWTKFKAEVEGEYGFNGYTELTPLKAYDETKDISGGEKTGKPAAQPADSDY